jgi:hypothetical protein
VIRQRIDDQDQLFQCALYADDDDIEVAQPEIGEPHASVWAKRKEVQFQELEGSHTQDPAFSQFRIRFNKFLNEFFAAYQIPLPGGKQVQLRKEDTVGG